jgi:hypothetical protein
VSGPSRYLVQILLPQYDARGEPIDQELFAATRRELIERFGGLTAYVRAPASGAWKEDDGRILRDDILIFEAMVDDLDREWWARYRRRLEERFRQQTVIARAMPIDLL